MSKHTPDKPAIERGRASARRLLKSAAPPRAPQAPPKRDLVFAIGDSWFNYWPRGDILDVLEDRRGQVIERAAQHGRKLAQVLYREPPPLLGNAPAPDTADGVEITWLIHRLAAMTAAEKSRLLAIVVSAGGNDVAGDGGVLASLVKPKDAGASLLKPKDALNEPNVGHVVDRRMRDHYLTLLACITEACNGVVDRPVPILMHGYDYPVADGRGVLGLRWLKPVLEKQGYVDLAERNKIMRLLIDRLNDMQKSLSKAGFGHVKHVDLRNTLKSTRYELDWQNELHPTIPLGFGKLSDKFIKALDELMRDA